MKSLVCQPYGAARTRRPIKTSADPQVGVRSGATAPRTERDEDFGVILDSLGSLTRELRLASWDTKAKLGGHGAQFRALRLMAHLPTTSMTELAKLTRTDISSVSAVVARLVERQLVTRTAVASDGRRVSLRLTARGRAVARQTPAPEATRLLGGASKLSGRALHALAAGLSALESGLRRAAD